MDGVRRGRQSTAAPSLARVAGGAGRELAGPAMRSEEPGTEARGTAEPGAARRTARNRALPGGTK